MNRLRPAELSTDGRGGLVGAAAIAAQGAGTADKQQCQQQQEEEECCSS